jgi:hypothetical protein
MRFVDVLRYYNAASSAVAVVIAVAVLGRYIPLLSAAIYHPGRFPQFTRARAGHIVMIAASHLIMLLTGGAWSVSQLGEPMTYWTLPLPFCSTLSIVAMVFMLRDLANQRRLLLREENLIKQA